MCICDWTHSPFPYASVGAGASEGNIFVNILYDCPKRMSVDKDFFLLVFGGKQLISNSKLYYGMKLK